MFKKEYIRIFNFLKSFNFYIELFSDTKKKKFKVVLNQIIILSLMFWIKNIDSPR